MAKQKNSKYTNACSKRLALEAEYLTYVEVDVKGTDIEKAVEGYLVIIRDCLADASKKEGIVKNNTKNKKKWKKKVVEKVKQAETAMTSLVTKIKPYV